MHIKSKSHYTISRKQVTLGVIKNYTKKYMEITFSKVRNLLGYKV